MLIDPENPKDIFKSSHELHKIWRELEKAELEKDCAPPPKEWYELKAKLKREAYHG